MSYLNWYGSDLAKRFRRINDDLFDLAAQFVGDNHNIKASLHGIRHELSVTMYEAQKHFEKRADELKGQHD